MTPIRIDGDEMPDEKYFDVLFAAALGFPNTYGTNKKACIDCMSPFLTGGAPILSVAATPICQNMWPKNFMRH